MPQTFSECFRIKRVYTGGNSTIAASSPTWFPSLGRVFCVYGIKFSTVLEIAAY